MNTATITPNNNYAGPRRAEGKIVRLDPRNYLSKELEDDRISRALASCEGVPETVTPHETKVEAQTVINKEKKPDLLRDRAPIYAYSVASVLHLLAGLSRITNILPKSIGKFLDVHAQKISKTVNCLNYGGKAITSYKANNSLDSISKLMMPILVPWLKLENQFLGGGLVSGPTMISTAHNPRITNRNSFFGNLAEHCKIYQEMAKELLAKGGWHKLCNNKDTHLMFMGGNMNLFGGLLGIALGPNSKVCKTIGSLVRNTGGAICDIAKILHGDINYVISGVLYTIVHGLDIWQSMSNDKEQSRTISHFVQSIGSVANYFYTQPSNTMADNTFHDRFKEARLKPSLQGTPA